MTRGLGPESLNVRCSNDDVGLDGGHAGFYMLAAMAVVCLSDYIHWG